MGVNRLKDAFELRFGKKSSEIIFFFIYKVTRYTPITMIKYFPKSLASLFGSTALVFNYDQNKVFQWANRAAQSKFSGHKKAAFFIKANFMFRNFSENEFKEFINKEVFSESSREDQLDFYTVWSFHNNSQQGYSNLMFNILNKLEASDLLNEIDSKRYLPEHTTNMGHLSALFLYGNYYRKIDPERHIVVWPDIAPNKFYLNEILKLLPFKVTLMKGTPNVFNLRRNQIDSLNYSRIEPGRWRLEPICAIPSEQNFPEYVIEEDFKLRCDQNLTSEIISDLIKIGFDPKKWFVVLHVKEHRAGFEAGGETRDSAIRSYRTSCQLIRDLGGQVVRMGSSNFPKLLEDFPAIDYAHSEIKSEQADYWLWGNCKFWIGNGNGTIWASLSFGKPRLHTNIWPLSLAGPNTDFYLPKLIYDKAKERLLTIEEMVTMKLSRNMKKELFTQSGLILIENSQELLRNSTLEMYESLKFINKERSNVVSTFESEIYAAMKASPTTPKMRLPHSYSDFLAKMRTTKFLPN
jgi:putative glycosyltransferase (TIGR04372 family)